MRNSDPAGQPKRIRGKENKWDQPGYTNDMPTSGKDFSNWIIELLRAVTGVG